MDFAYTRQENDEQLLGRLDAIQSGLDLEVLEPFAKAYLGLFYDIDSRVPSTERIGLLANPELATAIRAGFIAALQRPDLPACTAITPQCPDQPTPPLAYVILAGMDMLATRSGKGSEQDILSLSDTTLQAALCYHLTTNTFHDDAWYSRLLIEKPQLAADALLMMWQPLLAQKVRVLPGLHEIIKNADYKTVFALVIIPLLQQWPDCRANDLSVWLYRAMLDADQGDLSQIIMEITRDMENLPLRNKVYWLASGFLLDPEVHGQGLINFMGQDKIKLLPLLDFTQAVLAEESGRSSLSAMGYAYLIRCLASRFTPQEDQHGNLGEITMNVLWFFYQLATFQDEKGQEALHWLQTVRVLKLYKDVFKHMQQVQQAGECPDFPDFVSQLRENGYLRMKKKWSDAR